MPMGQKDHARPLGQQPILRQHRKLQHHLIHLRITVSPKAEKPIPPGIQQGDHLLGSVLPGQIVPGAVVENVPQQQEPVRLLPVHGLQQEAGIVGRPVQVRGNHQLHSPASRSRASARRSQPLAEASLGIRQSPRGLRHTEPTFTPSGRQLRLNCWVTNRR